MSTDLPSLKDLFLAAVAVPPADRAAWLRENCRNDLELLKRVEQMLAAHENPQSLLDQLAPETQPPTESITAFDDPISDHPTTVIGPYKLIQTIGEGGMGTIFMAQQTEPIRRLVALKLIKPGMDSHQVIARFEAERQALALMDHPNIARVLDAGTTTEGRPYFVMELVKGVPITRYCDENRLTPRQRLELFIPVCQAVQHAHQKGIIHRDLKPGNVLVAPYDGKPVPKVIDFGVAKAMGQQLTEHTLVTGFGAIVGTLEYMSPEQAELNQLDIDTRSDIYALGVILYELLTGTTPLDRKRLTQAAFTEMLRMIREVEPPKPSTRLSESKDSLPSISVQRQTEPAKLTRIVRGELDWIVMKALEKDRGRRYETANGLAMDVQRFLANEAVQACPPSASYRFRKFARRNRGTLALAGLFVLAIVTAVAALGMHTILISRQRAEIVRQRNEAEAQRKLARRAVDRMFTQVAERWLAKKASLQPLQKEILEDALGFYLEFAKEKRTDPELRLETAIASRRLGEIESALGQSSHAEKSFLQALALARELVQEAPTNLAFKLALADSHAYLAGFLTLAARVNEAEVHMRTAVSLYEELAAFPEMSRWKESLISGYGLLGLLRGGHDRPEAEKAYRRALEIYAALPPAIANLPDRRFVAGDIHRDYGGLLISSGRTIEGEQLLRKAISIEEKLVAEFPADVTYLNTLSWDLYSWANLARTGRPDEAERAYQRALVFEERLVKESPSIPDYLGNVSQYYEGLGGLLRIQGRKDAAEDALRKSLDRFETLVDNFP